MTVSDTSAPGTVQRSRSRRLIRLADFVAFVPLFASYFIFPEYLGLITRIMIMMLFVLSLDLVLGYAGIPTLGHATQFGVGAYAAGLYAIHISAEPISGLVFGAAAAALIAFATGLLLLRTTGLTLVLMSIAFCQVAVEVANKASRYTGGADGLGGISNSPIFGLFEFDLFGKVGFFYALILLALIFLALKRLVASPFGLSCLGIKQQPQRMRALGVPVYGRLLAMYTIAGAVAGIAGALSAQTTQIVSLESLGFVLSAEALVMLILGGAGRLYGALLGTALFMIVHHVSSAIAPTNWLFIIGGMVIAVVLAAPKGILSLIWPESGHDQE